MNTQRTPIDQYYKLSDLLTSWPWFVLNMWPSDLTGISVSFKLKPFTEITVSYH